MSLALQDEEYSPLAKLMIGWGDVLASSAACARGFKFDESNREQRNWLGEQHLDEIMHLKAFLSIGG